jgi:hypothetical protein
VKTDDLINTLAAGAGPAPRAVAARRLVPAVVAGGLASTLLAMFTLGLVPDLGAVGIALWVKLGYAAALAGAAGWLTSKLARPVSHASKPAMLVVVVLVAMALAGLSALLGAPSGERVSLLMGQSWLRCPWAVLAFSLPALAATLAAVRSLAPTRLCAAGLAAGLLAGAAGAFGYAFACVEQSAAFIALWYTLGIGMSGALGAALGPRVLRW